mmetsp:Transcript_18977/g.28303  ORF Transcript_18977/g.28303 Transcript_18977/m.28303 type:complete len:495 (-) Transcript_18977:253-1737(-)
MAFGIGGNKGSDPPVVQGVVIGEAVPPPADGKWGNTEPSGDYVQEDYAREFNGLKGEHQPKRFHDVFWGILFVAHLGFMGYLLYETLTNSFANGDDEADIADYVELDYSGVAIHTSVCAVSAIGISMVSLGFLMRHAKELVKMSLFFSVAMSLAVGVLGLLGGQIYMAVLGFIGAALGACYAWSIWSRIPFAAANLNTAITGVKANMGLAVIAFFYLIVAFVWSVWWIAAAGGSLQYYGGWIVFLFLISFYWVHQVIQNTVHVTSAGVIGTWWFVPSEASRCCSPAVKDSFVRATTFSFGSICLGSLIVAIIQALRALNNMTKEQDECNFLHCIIDCILGCLESIIEYFNKWAYVYVGLYGYSYIDAGKNVMRLFQNKGWTVLITDSLVENVLFMMACGIGLITGLIGYVYAKLDEDVFAGLYIEDAGVPGFLIGLFVGFLMGSVLLSVVESAVNTVIVCFAESPGEFQTNHPMLSREMRAAWKEAWPSECAEM